MKFRSVLLVAVAGLVLCASAQATPIFTFSVEYAGSYDSGWANPYNTLLTDPDSTLPTDIHEFHLMLQTSGASTSPDESFRLALLNINLGPGLSPEPTGAYAGEFPFIDPPPAGGGGGANGPVFSDNSDGGVDINDLQRVVIITNSDSRYPHAADPGEAGPYLLGYIFLNYDRALAPIVPPGSTEGSDITVSTNVPDDSLGYWSGTDPLLLTDDAFVAGPAVTVPGNPIPEPASIALFGLAMVGLVGFIRRR